MNLTFCESREDIHDAPLLWGGKDALELAVFGIALKFVNGQHAGQTVGLTELQQRKPAGDGGWRNTHHVGKLLSGQLHFKTAHGQECEAVGHVMPFGKQVIAFVEAFTAAGASVTALSVKPSHGLSLDRAILDPLYSIVMDPVGDRAAVGADTCSAFHFD